MGPLASFISSYRSFHVAHGSQHRQEERQKGSDFLTRARSWKLKASGTMTESLEMQLNAWLFHECRPACQPYPVNILFLPMPHCALLRDWGINPEQFSWYVAHVTSRVELVLILPTQSPRATDRSPPKHSQSCTKFYLR